MSRGVDGWATSNRVHVHGGSVGGQLVTVFMFREVGCVRNQLSCSCPRSVDGWVIKKVDKLVFTSCRLSSETILFP